MAGEASHLYAAIDASAERHKQQIAGHVSHVLRRLTGSGSRTIVHAPPAIKVLGTIVRAGDPGATIKFRRALPLGWGEGPMFR